MSEPEAVQSRLDGWNRMDVWNRLIAGSNSPDRAVSIGFKRHTESRSRLERRAEGEAEHLFVIQIVAGDRQRQVE